MESIVVLRVTHRHELPYLGEMIAGRTVVMAGVEFAEIVSAPVNEEIAELQRAGFTLAEISLGMGEVAR